MAVTFIDAFPCKKKQQKNELIAILLSESETLTLSCIKGTFKRLSRAQTLMMCVLTFSQLCLYNVTTLYIMSRGVDIHIHLS